MTQPNTKAYVQMPKGINRQSVHVFSRIETEMLTQKFLQPRIYKHASKATTLIEHMETCLYGGDKEGARQYAVEAAAVLVRFMVERL